MLARSMLLLLLSLSLVGCAPGGSRTRQTRTARALVGVGAAAMVIGLLAAEGCEPEAGHANGCSSGVGDGSPEIGLPVMAAGAAMILGGLAVEPKGPRRVHRVLPRTQPVTHER